MMLDAVHVIKRPLITEKATREANALRPNGAKKGEPLNRISFMVDRRADKNQIKKAVEEIYDVKVVKVRTQTRKGHVTRGRHGHSYSGDWKKAVVELDPGDRVELF